jgi:hypothetical protein
MRTIIRSGYVQHRKTKRITVHRKGGKTYTYTRKAGVTRVRPVPTKDVGAIGKGPKVIGKLKAGMLTRYHYHPVEATTNRHKALVRAVTKGHEDPHAVLRRLVAISTLTKRTLPRASRIYKEDARWVHKRWSSMFGRTRR